MIEYREVSGGVSGDGKTLVGLVTPFNVWTTIGDKRKDGFDERVAPTAFTKTLREQDVVLIHNHNTGMPMARTSIDSGPGSLNLTPHEARGLGALAEPVDTSYAKDVLKLAKAKVIRGMSFGFEVIKDSWTDDNGKPATPQTGTKRTIHEVRLHEVTTTAFPAYQTTELSVRDSINAARGVAEARAAVASYADTSTCADCGATSQYGAYCSNCGGSMDAPASGGKFCSSCGGKMPGNRSAHVCESRDAADGDGPDPKKPYGDVEYADPKNGKYPVDTIKHAKAAWAYINVASNADVYPLNGVTLESVKDKIKAALTKFGVEISEDERDLRIWLLECRDLLSDGTAGYSDGTETATSDGMCPTCNGSGRVAPDGEDVDDDDEMTRASEPVATTREDDAKYEAWRIAAKFEAFGTGV